MWIIKYIYKLYIKWPWRRYWTSQVNDIQEEQFSYEGCCYPPQGLFSSQGVSWCPTALDNTSHFHWSPHQRIKMHGAALSAPTLSWSTGVGIARSPTYAFIRCKLESTGGVCPHTHFLHWRKKKCLVGLWQGLVEWSSSLVLFNTSSLGSS